MKSSIHRGCRARAQAGESRSAQSPSDTAEHRVRTQALKGGLRAVAEDFGGRLKGGREQQRLRLEWNEIEQTTSENPPGSTVRSGSEGRKQRWEGSESTGQM